MRGKRFVSALLVALFASALLVAAEAQAGPAQLDVDEVPASESDAALALPRIPWEGGSTYWERFANARDWTDPGFFPIGIWYGGVSSDAEVAWDRDHGINFYVGMWEGTDFALFERGGVYWVGDGLNDSFDPASPNWPGVFLDDEVDGRFGVGEGLARLQNGKALVPPTQFSYANFSQMVVGPDLAVDAQERYVNLPDVVSVDMYWYTIPFCDWEDYRGDLYAEPVPAETCRTASSYGRTVTSLTRRDAADDALHPRWMFVENLNGLSGHEHVAYMEPGQVKGAAMNAIIHEARGLVWFNQSLTGPCQTTGALRSAQIEGDAFCGSRQIAAMGEVNRLLHDLAAVINTQSYLWEFGPGLDTMLKTHDGFAYIFAMTDGTAGKRTLQLPPELADASTVEVWGEDRDITVSHGRFSDEFEAEYTFHIYRVQL